MINHINSPFGSLSLKRWPPSSDTSLQAWDAADELLLQHLHEHCQDVLAGSAKLLICNDSHGALTCALHQYDPVSWSDSYLSHTATRNNWLENALPAQAHCLDSVSSPHGQFDLVLIKIPKTHALLEDQLARLGPLLHSRSVLIAGSMVRHLPKSAFALFEHYIGPVSTSLAVKKSRLIFCNLDAGVPERVSPYPDSYTDKALGITFSNHANVFCRDRVDIGARFFLANSHRLPAADTVIDLACGNGILGIDVQQRLPDAQLHFIDESYMAVASAKVNYANHIQRSCTAARFSIADGLEHVAANSVDLIICNPPFHAQHAIADDTARAFFKTSAACLNDGGQLWVVGNRHLPYRMYLKRHFKRVDVVASNAKFVLLCASA